MDVVCRAKNIKQCSCDMIIAQQCAVCKKFENYYGKIWEYGLRSKVGARSIFFDQGQMVLPWY